MLHNGPCENQSFISIKTSNTKLFTPLVSLGEVRRRDAGFASLLRVVLGLIDGLRCWEISLSNGLGRPSINGLSQMDSCDIISPH